MSDTTSSDRFAKNLLELLHVFQQYQLDTSEKDYDWTLVDFMEWLEYNHLKGKS